MSPRRPRPQLSALLAGALLTLLVLGLDLASSDAAIPGALRDSGAVATGPLLTAMTRVLPEPPDAATEFAETSAHLALTENALRRAERTIELTMSDTLTAATDSGHRAVLGRVVAIGALGPSGPERLTLDLGSRDGIAVDQSVVAPDGLVGRTVRVGATSADVLILGAADLVIGARAETSGLLGAVGPAIASAAPRQGGQLTFTAIAFGEATPGERLLTLGSPDDTPFVAGIPIGQIATVDPASGQVGLTAAVAPAVDIATLDVVAVIVPTSAAGAG